MIYKAKVAACSEIRTKHSTQGDHHVEFSNVKTWRYVKKPLGLKGQYALYPQESGFDSRPWYETSLLESALRYTQPRIQ